MPHSKVYWPSIMIAGLVTQCKLVAFSYILVAQLARVECLDAMASFFPVPFLYTVDHLRHGMNHGYGLDCLKTEITFIWQQGCMRPFDQIVWLLMIGNKISLWPGNYRLFLRCRKQQSLTESRKVLDNSIHCC